MRMLATLAAVGLLAVAMSTVNAANKPADSWESANVMKFGAKADAKTDNTVAFQKALDAAADKGGIVLVPAGTYLIAGSLNIPQGVTLKGVWEAPHHADIGKGSIIYATGGAGDENGKPLITLNQSSCIRGITVLYPNQKIDNIQPYPWTIQGKGMHCSVIDMTLVNPYKAIDFGTFWNELHYIKNVFGCPLKVGIFVDQCTDVGRIEDVHFNPHAWGRAAYPGKPTEEQIKKLGEDLRTSLIGFIIGKTDWEYMNNCFVIFPKIGYHFIATAMGAPNAVLTQCGSDVCPTAVQVDACQDHAGLAFSNCQLMSTVRIGSGNNGPVKFSNCGFWPITTTDYQGVIDGKGTITFTSCHFYNWGGIDESLPGILVKKGSVIINGCEFMSPKKTQIELTPGTVSAAIFGNRFHNGQRIINNAPADADIQIGLNIK